MWVQSRLVAGIEMIFASTYSALNRIKIHVDLRMQQASRGHSLDQCSYINQDIAHLCESEMQRATILDDELDMLLVINFFFQVQPEKRNL